MRLDYAREKRPLGTAAPLRAIPGLKETFLVLNGDILTDLDFRKLVQYHKQKRAVATVATFKRSVGVDFGVVEADKKGMIEDYLEKPRLQYKVSMGIYVFEPSVLKHLPRRGPFDFPELILRLLEAGEPVASFPFRGRWLDIGRPDDFHSAQAELARHPKRYLK